MWEALRQLCCRHLWGTVRVVKTRDGAMTATVYACVRCGRCRVEKHG